MGGGGDMKLYANLTASMYQNKILKQLHKESNFPANRRREPHPTHYRSVKRCMQEDWDNLKSHSHFSWHGLQLIQVALYRQQVAKGGGGELAEICLQSYPQAEYLDWCLFSPVQCKGDWTIRPNLPIQNLSVHMASI